jgi:hypothetical protein
MSTVIGPYTSGERPEPLEYSFLDADGAPVNLTGFTATFRLSINGQPGSSNAASVTTPLEGTVTYTWAADDLTAGALRAEFVATNGTNTYISDRLVGQVAAAIEVEA